MSENIVKGAQRIQEALDTRKTCDPIRDIIGIKDLEAAYAIQNIINRNRIAQGAKIVGKKIGLTSKAVQRQLGVDQPDYGTLFLDMESLYGAEIPWNETMQPKVEAEIAFILCQDLDHYNIGITDIIQSIDYALPSIEIVGSRIKDWNIKITDTIADNASASHFVLGHTPTLLSDLDVIHCKMQMTRNGEIVSEGYGADCLGSPLNATLWLARTMAKLGEPLLAGDIVLSGALGPMCSVAKGDIFEATIEGLGSVKTVFGK